MFYTCVYFLLFFIQSFWRYVMTITTNANTEARSLTGLEQWTDRYTKYCTCSSRQQFGTEKYDDVLLITIKIIVINHIHFRHIVSKYNKMWHRNNYSSWFHIEKWNKNCISSTSPYLHEDIHGTTKLTLFGDKCAPRMTVSSSCWDSCVTHY